jgi:hypothetical protein
VARFGIDARRLMTLYTFGFVAVQAALALGLGSGSGVAAAALWVAYVVLGVGTVVAYVILTHAFEPALAGRVNTAVNLAVFVVAFAMQAAVGYLLVWLEARGVPRAAAHGWTLAAAIVLQLGAWGWFALGNRGQAGLGVPSGTP